MYQREMSEEELQEKKERHDAGILLHHEIQELFVEIDRLKTEVNDTYADYKEKDLDRIVQIIKNDKLREALEEIASGDHDVWECERIAQKALDEVR